LKIKFGAQDKEGFELGTQEIRNVTERANQDKDISFPDFLSSKLDSEGWR